MTDAPSVLPNGPLYGHYSHKRQLYTVYSGSSDIVRHTPTPEEAPVIDNNTINPFFRQPRYLSLNYPYLLFIPRNYPWRDNFFKIFDRPRHKLPIISDEDNGFCLHHDVAEHWLRMELCLRALGNAMFQLAPQQALYRFVNSWFFPARFKFLLSFRSERAARFAAACSRDNFLPLLGYVSMGLWCMHSWETAEVARGADPPDWRSMITEKTTKVHSAFLSYLEESVVGNWREERVGALYRIPAPEGVHHKEREARRELEWLLGTILRSTVPGTIPIYLSWGNLPRQISSFDVPPAFLDFVPDTDELEYLASSPQGELIFSRWTVDSASLVWYRDPYMPPVAPAPLPPPRRTQRSEHAKKGQVPSKARVFVWEEQDGHYIRQPGGRGNYEDLWSEYNGPRRRFDPISNEWDLCEIFENSDPVFGEGYDEAPSDDDDDDDDDAGNHPIFPQNIDMASRLPPKDDSMQVVQTQPREDNTMQVVPTQPRDADTMQVMQTQRLHDIEMESLDYGQPGDEDLGPDMAESDIPVRDLTEASRNCVTLVYLKFGLAPRTDKPEYESSAGSLLRALEMRYGFLMPQFPENFVPLNPPQACLKPQLLANVVGMRDIGGQLAAEKGLANILGIFFGQCIQARSVNDIDRNLLDFHHALQGGVRVPPKTKLFQIRRENLKSMRNPSEEAYYYVVSKIGSGIGSEALLIPRATDLIEILRQQWGPELKDVAQHLLARGIPFRLAYVSTEIMPARETPAPLSHRPKGFMVDTSSGLGFRPENYKFDVHDYNAYTTQRDLQLLHTPRGRIALQYGGVIGRLARSEVSDDDFFRGFSDDIYDVGDCLWNGVTTWAYWHDRLSDHEIDLLCGVYHVRTGQKRGGGKDKGKQGHGQDESDAEQTSIVSWWPKPSAWARGSLDGAWWTPQCEDDFFQKRLTHFEKGVYILQRQSVWRHNLKFQKDVKKCWDGYERVASSIVDRFVNECRSLVARVARPYQALDGADAIGHRRRCPAPLSRLTPLTRVLTLVDCEWLGVVCSPAPATMSLKLIPSRSFDLPECKSLGKGLHRFSSSTTSLPTRNQCLAAIALAGARNQTLTLAYYQLLSEQLETLGGGAPHIPYTFVYIARRGFAFVPAARALLARPGQPAPRPAPAHPTRDPRSSQPVLALALKETQGSCAHSDAPTRSVPLVFIPARPHTDRPAPPLHDAGAQPAAARPDPSPPPAPKQRRTASPGATGAKRWL
ncbi:hypothetical protein B0H10DRAFT_2245081 [Mycena sp. CBHHK59/15]|nr:hypothetical protein B0H10DRAFT_2245081 [Mycena sp. CBHHK59/15]